jgi:hypothetical protein
MFTAKKNTSNLSTTYSEILNISSSATAAMNIKHEVNIIFTSSCFPFTNSSRNKKKNWKLVETIFCSWPKRGGIRDLLEHDFLKDEHNSKVRDPTASLSLEEESSGDLTKI